MEVKDLIVELLEFDLNMEVEVGINSAEEDDDFEFEVAEGSWGSRKYLALQVDLKDYVLVNKRDYDDMLEKFEDLEGHIEDLNDQLETLLNE